MTDLRNYGLDIVVAGSIISLIGVVYNNLLLNHIAAMQIWCISNILFSIYFFGRWRQWWDGGICDEIMCGLYLFMFGSGVWGLMQNV